MLPFTLVHHHDFFLPFGSAHVFPGVKYRLIRERLLATGAASPQDFAQPETIPLSDVLRVHQPDYLDRLLHGTLSEFEIRRMELPYSRALVDATLLGTGGTLLAARLALAGGVAVSIGGGFHHAHPGHGEGFCILHDVAIALRTLLAERAIRNALVIDLDVHHGNGTAAIFPPLGASDAISESLPSAQFTGSGQPSADGVFTLSLHQRNNYPAYKPPSSLDVHLDDATGDRDYLAALDHTLTLAFERIRPGLIAYIAGADPYIEDQLGGLALSIAGLQARDRAVFRAAQLHGVPIFSVYAGGYARSVDDTVTIHANTVLAAAEVYGFHGASSC